MTARKSYSHTGSKKHPLDRAHWESRYTHGDTPWDHGEPSPGLFDFLAHETYVPGKVLVPGCGAGHDCRELARHGFDVTGVDISHAAIDRSRQLAANDSLPIHFEHADCLHPPAQWKDAFDWVFEHTCFCAIDPDLRDEYARAMASVVRSGGHLLGVFFNIQPESGPPFGTTREELMDRFGHSFDLILEKVPRSFPNRAGEELLMLWQKK
ncbi:MAG: methyltransferase domain-containing protein [Verrucomicrobiae bacterium]|nr:methyltransferase domain-containing protein [Verrucomicrobiae bacterium]